MSLDDVRNPHHAAALERGEDPRTKFFATEQDIRERIARWLDHDGTLSERYRLRQAGRILAERGWFVTVFGEIAPEGSRVLLQQQQVSHYSDEDAVLERLHELRAEEALLYGYLRDMKSVYADGYDPDRLGEREDDRRLSQEARDEKAANDAPRSVA